MASDLLGDAERGALLETLRPWMRVLRERTFLAGALDVGHLAPSDVVWLRLPATWAVDLRVFEAFELLALAGGVDGQLWQLALSSATTGSRSQCSVCSIGCVLSFSGIDEFPNAVLAWSARMVSGADPGTASDEYVRARDWLEGLSDGQCKDSAVAGSKSIEIPVSIWLHEGTFEETMEQLAAVVSMRPPRRDSSTRMASERAWKSLFRVVEVNPGIPDVVTANSIRSMTEIASQGVMIDKFKPNGMVVTSETASIFALGLQLLLGCACEAITESTCAAVKVAELPAYMPRRTVTAIFSALRTSRSVRSLSINSALSPWQPDPDDAPGMSRIERDHLWRWIAFSVFGRYAAHCMDHILINVEDLTAEDVRAFRSQLRSFRSIPPVQERSQECLEVSGCAVVSTCSSARAPTTGESQPGTITIQLPPQEVLIVGGNDGESQQVMVPGFGVAWVKAEDVFARSEEIRVHACAVHHLSIENLNERSQDPGLELLQTVGEGIRSLSIVHVACPEFLDGWIRDTIEACPHLEALRVSGNLALRSMEVFTAMLRQGVWGFQRLQLDNLTLLDIGSVEHFFHTLTECSTQTSLRVRHLELTFSGLDIACVGIEIVDAVATFLRSNHTLRVLVLKLSYLPHTSLRLDIWNAAKRVSAHHLEPISVRRAPLGIEKKLAFLSVLQTTRQYPRSAVNSRVAAQLMDRPLIAMVFAFAAECDRRRVDIRFSKDEE